jgi:SAM-dependent methyltransferase
MSEVWNKVYKSDSTFFGEEPSNFALLCFNHMKANNVKKVLELGAGHGRDTIFFASNGIEVDALDYSPVATDILNKIAREKRLPIKSQTFDVKNPLPFADGYFDAVYSHMLFNMRFSEDELHFAFSEIRRVLKPEGLTSFLLETVMTNPMVKVLKWIKKFSILMAFKSYSLQKENYRI